MSRTEWGVVRPVLVAIAELYDEQVGIQATISIDRAMVQERLGNDYDEAGVRAALQVLAENDFISGTGVDQEPYSWSLTPPIRHQAPRRPSSQAGIRVPPSALQQRRQSCHTPTNTPFPAQLRGALVAHGHAVFLADGTTWRAAVSAARSSANPQRLDSRRAMSLRGKDAKEMVAITSFWTSEGNLLRAGTVLESNDPIVRRCQSFFTEAALMPALDPDAMREAQRRLWAEMTASEA